MKGRERVLKALNFQEPDKVPLDIGGARTCGISIKAYKRLVNYLGISLPEVETSSIASQLAKVDEIVYQKLGVDVRPVGIGNPSGWQFKLQEDDEYFWYWDEWGRKLMMPKDGGYYFDTGVFPLEKTELENYTWPDPADESRFAGLQEKARHILDHIGAAVVAPNCLANGFQQMGAKLHGYTHWFLMLAAEPAKTEKFMDALLEFKIKFWDAYLTRINGQVDVICESDDLGTQQGTWISKEMFRRYIKPRYIKLFTAIKKKADVKISLHSCGACYDFIPDLIEAGVDILNPIQVSAAHMDTKRLKKEFGSDLVFWGGGVDTQKVLPCGTPQEVKDEVKRRIDDLAPGGGFVFAAVHNIQADVPPENILAMLEALDQYGKY